MEAIKKDLLSKRIYKLAPTSSSIWFSQVAPKQVKFTGHTTLSGTPGGGKERFFGGGPLRKDLLSKRHSPIFP